MQASGGTSKPLSLLLDQPQFLPKLTSIIVGLGSIPEAAEDGQTNGSDPAAKVGGGGVASCSRGGCAARGRAGPSAARYGTAKMLCMAIPWSPSP